MFTFNEFQYFSYIEEIYNYLINSPEEAKSAIKAYYGEQINKKTIAESFISGVKTGAVIGEIGTLLVALFGQNPDIISRCMPPSLSIFFTASIVETILSRKKRAQIPEDLYGKYIEDACSDFSFAEEFIPSDDQIHEMTAALNTGEMEDKYARLDVFGKCPVSIEYRRTQDTIYYWNLPVENGTLSRMYEVAMHVAANPQEGYEDVIREMYQIIRAYVHTLYSKDNEVAEGLNQRFEELRANYVANRGK